MTVEIPREILTKANKEHWTRGRVRPNDPSVERVPILYDGEVVGFYTPHVAASGEQRIGPVYVMPEWRGLGLVSAIYRSISGPMLACIEDGNEAAIRLHERAGFKPLRRYSHGWYWRRE